MKSIFDDLIKNIPDYTEFLTVKELDESSKKLSECYPECVKLMEVGKTRRGKPLYCLKIGNNPDKPNALFLGCPHPNEPIGAMMIEYLSQELAKSKELREEFGYNCYMIKAWDYDGLELNENWLKGPFTVKNYARNMFRPASHLQVDWTFPVTYREFCFNETLPETKAVMSLIDTIKPKFIYSLHNAGFGGVYWYISRDLPVNIYTSMHNSTEKQGIPLHLGEAEVPILKELYPAIFRMGDITELYDFLHENMGAEAAKQLDMGNNSAAYGKSLCDAFSLLTELPFFIDQRVNDVSTSEYTRGECILKKLAYEEESDVAILELLASRRLILSEENPFLSTLISFTKTENSEATEEMIGENEEYQKPATEAERFSSIEESRFYKLLSFGMLVRLFEYELERSDLSEERLVSLREAKDMALCLFEKHYRELLPLLNYEAVAIKKLVTIQLESGLLVAKQLLSSV